MNAIDCKHSVLQFASGDYYLICQTCNSYWARTVNGEGQLTPNLSTAFLQNEQRVAKSIII
jgi:hypothetical protein